MYCDSLKGIKLSTLPHPGGPQTSVNVPGIRYPVQSLRMENLVGVSFEAKQGIRQLTTLEPTVSYPSCAGCTIVWYEISLNLMTCVAICNVSDKDGNLG